MNSQQQKVLVSIVIPVYNSGDCICEAINSIITQGYEPLEIIIINDGSTDNTAVICKEIEKRYANIIYYEQQNQGPSAARNYGLAKAQGEYVLFLDADDSLSVGAISALVSCAKNIDADIVIGCNDCGIISEKTQRIDMNDAMNAALCGNSYMEKIEQSIRPFINMGSPWAKLIKRKILVENQLTFPTSISHREDLIFCINVYAHSEKIILLSRDVYHYNTMNENSLVRMYNKDKVKELISILDELGKVEEYIGISSEVKNIFAWNAIYEVWVKYFTHRNYRESKRECCLQLRAFLNQERIKKILDNYKFIGNNSLPMQGRIILILMKYGMCAVLSIVACFWRKMRNVNRL